MDKNRFSYKQHYNAPLMFGEAFDGNERLTVKEMVDLLNEQQATITALKEENEHFKKQLKRFKDWINSDKYDYELTLAFIKNKGYSLKDVLEYEKGLKE